MRIYIRPQFLVLTTLFASGPSSLLILIRGVMGVPPSEISINHRHFADDLTTELYAEDNECTSTWGISMAFSLVYPSSVGATEEQMRTLFRYPDGSQQILVWDETATRIDASYEGQCLQPSGDGVSCQREAPLLEIANSVWIDEGYNLNPNYQAIVQDNLYEIEFSDITAGEIINDWVEDSTLGLIDSVVDDGPLPPTTVLLAVNAIYLKAPWEDPFARRHTNRDIFYTSPSRGTELSSQTHFMHKIFKSVPYSHDALPGFQVLQIPFTGNLSMIFALPTSDRSGEVSSVDVLSAVSMLSGMHLAVALPKFIFESEYRDDLILSLMNLGMVSPFMEGLCIAANAPCDAFISDVIHKTVIDVNEEGVEAAAATVVMVDRSDPFGEPTLFMADQPFQFFIYDGVEELVIFEGRVGNPGIAGGAEDPALSDRHSESTFWTANFGVDPIIPEFPEPRDDPTPEPTPAPTPESTPGQPTLEPTPLITPGPTPEPTPAQTPESTPEPTPEPSPGPTPESTPGQPTLEPTPVTTPEPTMDSTPEPTRPEPTPEPTSEPTPLSTPEPTSSPTTDAPRNDPTEAPDSAAAGQRKEILLLPPLFLLLGHLLL